jgi:hypothetical protein
MRFIPTKVHGILDYLSGILLIAAPWIFNFANGGAAQWVPVIMGAAILLMAVMTNYERGLVKSIPMSTHLAIDVIGGIFLAASPWLFGFNDVIIWPHLLFGILEIGAGLFTHKTPDYQRSHSREYA